MAFPPLQQGILNENLERGTWEFEMADGRGYNATINLEAMEQLCYGVVRYLQLRDESGRVTMVMARRSLSTSGG